MVVLSRYQTVLHTRAFPFGFRSGTSAVSYGAVISPYMTGRNTVMVAASGMRLKYNYREAPVSASAINSNDPQCQRPRPSLLACDDSVWETEASCNTGKL